MTFSEDLLVERLKKRDSSALECIINIYGQSIYSVTKRIVEGACSKEDIEECVSDVFITCWKNIEQFDSTKGSFKSWLFILTKYKALDYRRNNSKKLHLVGVDESKQADINLTEKNYIIREEVNELIEIVETLSPLHRDIFYRKYFFYESVDDIAKSTDISRKSVENHLYHLRKKIRNHFQKKIKEGKDGRI